MDGTFVFNRVGVGRAGTTNYIDTEAVRSGPFF